MTDQFKREAGGMQKVVRPGNDSLYSFPCSAWECIVDALRPELLSQSPAASERDAERPLRHSHAERGNERSDVRLEKRRAHELA